MDYNEFLQSKLITSAPSGFDIDRASLPAKLYEYQKDLVQWGCKRGKAALFCMTGTGKTAMQVAWADQVVKHTGGKVLILAPLAVSRQTVLESAKFGINVHICRMSAETTEGADISNYEKLHHFNPADYAGIVLDESSIIKDYAGKTRQAIIDFAQKIPYRLACTATPSPNDYMELGNHAEFLGVMSYTEMLATFFVHDGGDTSKWRIKGHAEESFWKWLATWGVFLTKPSDLGYSDEGFDLPPLHTFQHVVDSAPTEGNLFVVKASSMTERRAARKESLERRVAKCAEIVFSSLVGSFCAKLAENGGGSANGMETRVCCQPEKERDGRPAIQSEEDGTSRAEGQRETEGIHAPVCAEKPLKVQENSGTTGTSQRSTEEEIRGGRGAQGEAEICGKRMESGKPSAKTGTEVAQIQHDDGPALSHAIPAELLMCDMRALRHNGEELLSGGGSLPHEGTCARLALHELQHGAGEVHGLARIISESGRVPTEKWCIWCDLNVEQETLAKMFGPLCVSIQGSTQEDDRIELEEKWRLGNVPILISKPSVFGYGMNWQHCNNTAFIGLSDSFEALFQATKRFHRHGQTREVNRHLIISEAEGHVLNNVKRKEKEFDGMIANMVEHTKTMTMENIRSLCRQQDTYLANKQIIIPTWLVGGQRG